MAGQVEWMEWSKEAFDKAREEDKPVLLDIMAQWCHWCHMMDTTTYSDPEVGDVIRERFIPIRVDTDARPDINSRYNRGGWPTTAILTPNGDLIGGGTYFPPAQLKQTLLEYANFYREHKDRILEQIRESRVSVSEQAILPEETEESGIDVRVVERAVDDIRSNADLKHGGFGRAPKFPHPEAVELAMLWHHTHKDDVMHSIATLTLDSMAGGGICDQLGGGFHRYAVDAAWRVPHFEKLLDVNSLLLSTYSTAYRMFRNESYRHTAEGIICFLESVLSTSEPVFYSSQDADVHEGDDGSYFTWTVGEVRNALPEREADAAVLFYGLTTEGDIESTPGRNVLHQTMTHEMLGQKLGLPAEGAAEMVKEINRKLWDVRAKRVAPRIDKKILANWNALAAQGYFKAYEAMGEMRLLQRALAIVDFLIAHCIAPDGSAFHYIEGLQTSRPRRWLHGQLFDHAAIANACLDAYEATGNRDYLIRSQQLVGYAGEHLRSPEGGYLDSPAGPEDFGELAVKDRSIYDNAEMARALARLYMLTGEIGCQDDARTALATVLPEYERAGYLASGFALAADFLLNYPVEFVTVGPPDDPATVELHNRSLRLYEPRRIVQLLDPERDRDLIEKKGYVVTERPTLFMCVSTTCAPPIHDPQQLDEVYSRFHTMAGVA